MLLYSFVHRFLIIDAVPNETVYLSVNGADGDADECSFKFPAVFSSVALGSTQDGDATVTFNFEIAASADSDLEFTWEEV